MLRESSLESRADEGPPLPRSRPKVINVGRLPLYAREAMRLEEPEDESLPERPKTREDCRGGVRPCPFVSCRHHLYLDVSATNGSIKLNFPHLEVGDMGESCSLDVAERGGVSSAEVGAVLNTGASAMEFIEADALERIREWAEEWGDGARAKPRKRRLPLL